MIFNQLLTPMKVDFKSKKEWKWKGTIQMFGFMLSLWRDTPKQHGCINIKLGKYLVCINKK